MKVNRSLFIRIAILVLAAAGAFVSFRTGFETGTRAAFHFRAFFREMIAFLPALFVLIGLLDVWVPRERVERHIGKESGVRGMFWVILLAMLQAGPLYGAFPVSYMLWKKGCSVRNIFIYLGAFATLKIPMLTFETGFLGWRFTLVRTALTLPVFILIAIAMERLSDKKRFSMNDPG
jgi:uncharacterized membrane protein YraQ (UPF0718 family)